MSMDNIFKSYDIRGLVPDELNEDIARKVGAGFARFLSENAPDTVERSLVVGYDMRADSEALAMAVIEGMRSQGRDVINIGRVATDMLYFAVGHLEAAGGIVVTASHNPGAYNGMKICREEARPVGEMSGLMDIKQMVIADDFTELEQGSFSEQDVMEAWVSHALSFTNQLKPYKIAVDAGNGMAGMVIPHLDGKTPLEITPMYFELDGAFPNHEANPLKEETLDDLKQKIVKEQLDFGLAFDGDGDRVVMVDEKGQSLDGGVMSAILIEHFLKEYPGSTILYDARASWVASDTIREYGGVPVRTKVGHSNIKAAMREHDAPFGGEQSGHYYFRDNWSADSGLIAALIAISVLSEFGGSLSELANRFRNSYHHSGEINFEVEDKQGTIERIAAEFSDGEADQLDGLSVSYPNWWFNVRMSNTEPLLRLNVEAKEQQQLEMSLRKLETIITA